VKATDSHSNPIAGVTVNEETNTAASPDQIATTACGVTSAAGVATCNVHNGGQAGTDSLVFWVDNDNGTTHTAGPDQGEPQVTASAVFKTGPAVSLANSSTTCVQALSGSDQGKAKTDCTVSTATHTVTYTATVEDATAKPLSGVTVNFAATSATLGGTAVTGTNLPSGTGTTGTNGQATFVVNDPSAAAGDSAVVKATVDGNVIGTATVHWAAPHATALSVLPADKSVVKGGTVTVKAQVVDQFGTAVGTTPTLAYVVQGRNLGKTGTAATDGTITYVDAGTVPASNSDTIVVTDVADALSGTATVPYVTSITPTSVAVDTSGHGTSDASCGLAANTAATGVASGATTEVCAVVKNASSEPLAGDSVTFTVSNGQVAAHSGLTTTSGTTYVATTDAAGVAFADVTSTKAGAQTVTATDTATGTNTVTYTAPVPADAYKVAATPATATIAPGGSQTFVATVTDVNGNPVAGVSVTYGLTAGSVGSVGNGSNTVTTLADGTASITVTVPTTSTSGTGTLSFSIPSTGNKCTTTGGACTASATYSVAASGASALVLRAPASGHVGRAVAITGHATNASGAPMAGQLVRFYVGVGGKAVAIGSGTTGAAGNTTVRYTPTKAGNLSFAAFVDSNGDQIREATEPTANATVSVGAGVKREHPVLSLVSKVKNAHTGYVIIHVTPNPAAGRALVRYFVKTNGAWHQIRANYTGAGGRHAKVVITRPTGKRLTFRVTVARTSSTTFGTSPTKSITVK
jgi:adhesin/invasin